MEIRTDRSLWVDSEDCVIARRQVVKERLVKRFVTLESLDYKEQCNLIILAKMVLKLLRYRVVWLIRILWMEQLRTVLKQLAISQGFFLTSDLSP